MQSSHTHPHSSPQVFDYQKRPFLVIWETTHACDLACVHCRANAEPTPKPDELTTEEAKKLIRDVRDMKTPIFVFSGGDCLKRPDLFELVRYAKSFGIRTGAIPAVTPLLTQSKIQELKSSGLDQIAFSLDAVNAKDHDAFRKVSGVFDRTLQAVRESQAAGISVQINSLVNIHNLSTLDSLISLIEELGVVFWEVFFLVPTGRGTEIELLNGDKFEQAFDKIYELQKRVKFIIKVTEAPHYRRFCIEKEMVAMGLDPREEAKRGVDLPSYLRKSHGPRGSIGMAPQGVNSGKGFVFISCSGEVFPSGFLPIKAGSLRDISLGEIYRDSPLLKDLRDASKLKGRCGICPYAEVCGGSRSRAFAMLGDPLAEDPCCSYQPASKSLTA